jgi:hypothetical protein
MASMRHVLAARHGLVAVLALVCAPGLAAAPAPITLAYKAKKDDVIRYRFALKAAFEISGPMGEGQIELSQEQFLTFRVLDVDEKGTLHARVTVERLRGGFEMPMMGTSERFDTDEAPPAAGGDAKAPAPAENGMVKFARALKGGSFECWLTPQGKVRKIEGATKLVAAAREKAGDTGGGGGAGMPFMGSGLSVGTLAEQYGDQGMAQLLETALPRLPEAAVDVGDSWKSPSLVAVPAIGHDLSIDLTLALESVEGDVAKLLAAGTLAPKRRPAPAKSEGGDPMADMQAELLKGLKFEISESSVDGTVRFDTAKCLPEETAITSTLTAALEFKMPGMDDQGGGGDPQALPGMKIDVKGTVRVHSKLLSLTHGSGGEGF